MKRGISVHSRSPATHSAEVRVQAKGAPARVKDGHDNVIHLNHNLLGLWKLSISINPGKIFGSPFRWVVLTL